MNYTEKEIKNIKYHSFDRGWKCGALAVSVFLIIVFVSIAIYYECNF